MHIVLTDVLTCPRCGPDFGLIVLAHRIEDRDVVEGYLGCANCHEQYPVRDGVADLRREAVSETPTAGPNGGTAPAEQIGADADKPLRMAALLGLTGPTGPVAVVSRAADLVRQMQELLPESRLLGVSPVAPDGEAAVGMGWLLASGRLPFRSRSLGGLVLAGGEPSSLVAEGLRVLGRGARLVIEPVAPDTTEALLREGAELLLQQDGVAVAFDPRAG